MQEQQPSRSRWFRWSEYGSALVVIPGVFLSILTGQFAFSAFPLTLSLWLNLFRRQYGDRAVFQTLYAQQRNWLHRDESVLESFRRERATLLMDRAGDLEERDHPQLMNVLEFRLKCIEKNRDALQTFFEESLQMIEASINEIQGLQTDQSDALAQVKGRVKSSVEARKERQEVWNRLESIAEKIDQMQETLLPLDQRLLKDFELRLQAVDQAMVRLASPRGLSVDDAQVQELWRSLEDSMMAQLTDLSSQVSQLSEPQRLVLSAEGDLSGADLKETEQSLEAQLDAIHVALMEPLNAWERLYQDEGYKLQRLNERLATMTQDLEQTYHRIFEQSGELEQALLQPQLMGMDFEQCRLPELDVDRMRQQLDELQAQWDEHLHSMSYGDLQFRLNQIVETAAARLEQISTMVTIVEIPEEDQINMVLTPLLQHLSDCEDKLSHPIPSQAGQELEGTLLELEAQVLHLNDRLESIQVMETEDLKTYHDLQVQLSVIRYRAEELKSEVAIKIDQIPYLIDNYLQQRFPIKDSSKL